MPLLSPQKKRLATPNTHPKAKSLYPKNSTTSFSNAIIRQGHDQDQCLSYVFHKMACIENDKVFSTQAY